jgi:hypothetical protein
MSRSGTRLTYPMSVVCPFSSVGSTSRCNTGVKPLRWGFECQSLTWPFVELTSRSPRRKATQLRLDGRMEMKNVKSGTQVGRAAGSAPCLRRNLPWCLLRLTVYPMRCQQRDLGTGALTEMRAARGCRLLGCVGPKWTQRRRLERSRHSKSHSLVTTIVQILFATVMRHSSLFHTPRLRSVISFTHLTRSPQTRVRVRKRIFDVLGNKPRKYDARLVFPVAR